MPLAQGFNADGSGNIGLAAIVSAASPTYTAGGLAPLSLNQAGGLRVDGSAVTQPVSVTTLPLPAGASTSANQVTTNASLASIDAGIPAGLGAATIANAMPVTIASDQVVPISATALPLPVGAATSALQTAGNASLTAITGQLPATLGSKTSANSFAVVLASDQVIPTTAPTSNTAVLTQVTASTSSVVLLAASASTKGFIIVNDSTSVLYVACAATTTTSAYTYKLFPNQTLREFLTYNGVLSGIWVTANGSAKVTQQT